MLKDALNKNERTNVNSREIEKLKESLPQYFDQEGNFNLEAFKEMLTAEEIGIEKEGYGLDFLGKSWAKYESALETETVLTPDKEHNKKDINKNSDNLYLIGDNIDGLKHLLKSYSNKINTIYIDPPYNTGSDDFVYPDHFSFNAKEMSEKLGIEEDEAERILSLEGQSTHSAWLTFMYPRLLLARDLLSESGVIFISIDDNELYNLKLICDEIFGEENFIANSLVASNSTKNHSNYIAVNHEYVLCYAKNIDEVPTGWKVEKNQVKEYVARTNQLIDKGLSYDEIHDELLELVKYPRFYDFDHFTYVDEKGIYETDNPGGVTNGNTQTDIIHPETKKITAKPVGGWRYNDETIKEMIENNQFHFGKDETIIPRVKRYLSDYHEQVPKSTLFFDSQGSTKWLKNKGIYFDFPKPVELIQHLISYIDNKDMVILDFFAGSSTTAEAVMRKNMEDDGNRKYIMIQLPEAIENNKINFNSIDELGRRRIEIAASEIKNDTNADIDYGFKTYMINDIPDNTLSKLSNFNPDMESNLLSIDFSTEVYNFNDVSGSDTILTTLLNKDGYGLGVEVEAYKLSTYLADRYKNTLYLIDEGLTSDDVMALIKDLENGVLDVNRVVIYSHSISFSVLHELRNNLKNLKNSKTVHLIEEY